MAGFQDKHHMSMELNRAFDDSGFSECARQFKYKVDSMSQVLFERIIKTVGSCAEGTQFSESDVDLLIVEQTDVKIAYNSQEACPVSGKPFLYLTRGPSTPAGYTKLQINLNGIKFETLQRFYRYEIVKYNSHSIFLTNRKPTKLLDGVDMTVHGPAQTIQINYFKTCDQVIAYESKIIPIDMNSWFERTRLKSWPSKTTCNLFKLMGCCYVAVGHSNSSEQDIEWRISPTKQELYIMLNLNPTQFRCYILLKLIKKHIYEHCGDGISSYHCKTALFWTIENSKNNIWQPRNLIKCVLKCLKLLLKWVTEKNCPNYFIPKENMFETKVINASQLELLQEVISTDFTLMFLSIIMRSNSIEVIVKSTVFLKQKLIYFTNETTLITGHKDNFQHYIELIKTKPRDACIQEFQNMVSPHTIDIDILLEMLEEKLSCLNRNNHIKSLIENKTLSEKDIAAHLNDMSKKPPHEHNENYCLKLASIAAARGAYSTCDVLLQNISGVTRLDNFCRCDIPFMKDITQQEIESNRDDLVINNISENIMLTEESINQLSIKDVLQKFTVCLQFFESENEAGIVLSPLHFDALKTVGIPPEIISITKEIKTADLISIHPIVYMYFLQHKNSSMMNNKGDMCLALEKLEHINLVSLQKGIYSHPDTTLNLLGHIYMTRGWDRQAVQCFRRSWQIQPYYNAVKWHVMFMLFHNLSFPEFFYLMCNSKRKRINSVNDEISPCLKLKKLCK